MTEGLRWGGRANVQSNELLAPLRLSIETIVQFTYPRQQYQFWIEALGRYSVLRDLQQNEPTKWFDTFFCVWVKKKLDSFFSIHRSRISGFKLDNFHLWHKWEKKICSKSNSDDSWSSLKRYLGTISQDRIPVHY